MLTRLYKNPRLLDALACTVTKTPMTAGVPMDVRQRLTLLDPLFISHLALVMAGTANTVDRLSIAANSGLIQCIVDDALHGLVLGYWDRWVEEACYSGDLAMLLCLRNYGSRLIISPESFVIFCVPLSSATRQFSSCSSQSWMNARLNTAPGVTLCGRTRMTRSARTS